jgi:hypothetical protein
MMTNPFDAALALAAALTSQTTNARISFSHAYGSK